MSGHNVWLFIYLLIYLYFFFAEPENVLNMFLKLNSISINQYGRDRETYQSALLAVMWYQVACHMVVRSA